MTDATQLKVERDYTSTETIAFMALAQSATVTVQDAAAHLRSTQMIAAATIAQAFRHLQATGEAHHAETVTAATASVRAAAEHFEKTAQTAIDIIKAQRTLEEK